MGEGISRLTPDAVTSIETHCQRLAKSGMVPKHYQGNPSAVYTAVCIARAIGEDETQFMQATYEIGGKIGMTSSYLLSRLRKSGAIRGTVKYHIDGKGDSMSVAASCVDSETGETVMGPTASMEMAKAEGWTKNPKYKSMPEIMLRNRALSFLVRYQYPDVLAGMHTVDELEDVRAARAVVVSPTGGALAAIAAEAGISDGVDGAQPDEGAAEGGCAADPADAEGGA